jgi:hypothetical protein
MAVQAEIIIRRVIIVSSSVDDSRRSRPPIVHAKEWVGDSDGRSESPLQTDLVHAGQRFEVRHRGKPLIDDR